ncbi:MAG: hypothetical protein ABIA75_10640 [Candidatus Neomarinimicrobiota bacterium]
MTTWKFSIACGGDSVATGLGRLLVAVGAVGAVAFILIIIGYISIIGGTVRRLYDSRLLFFTGFAGSSDQLNRTKSDKKSLTGTFGKINAGDRLAMIFGGEAGKSS